MHPEDAQREAAESQILVLLTIQNAPKTGRQIPEPIAVEHPEGAQREAAKSRILLLLDIQKALGGPVYPGRSESEPSSRTETGEGREGGRPDARKADTAKSRILLLLCIQNASIQMLQNRGFHCCCAFERPKQKVHFDRSPPP